MRLSEEEAERLDRRAIELGIVDRNGKPNRSEAVRVILSKEWEASREASEPGPAEDPGPDSPTSS